MTKDTLTQKRLKEVLSYDPVTGVFTNRYRRGPALKGEVSGSITTKGYRVIWVDMICYQAHRLAWLYTYGNFPSKDIDHLDRDATNNSIDNLRDVSKSTNHRNRGVGKNNTSGVMGVHWNGTMWVARISAEGKRKVLGSFLKIEGAIKARKAAEKFYGYSQTHGVGAAHG